ncbi:MAG: methyl-accepting chemotaxis protein [Planctomycetaceae bacterium]|nr:methyl-accepting chemotaxis protein [Planctomycetaceae bacterium]MCP4464450.1 methyl-accepting chemotaxis protein [Planctomycetaceae bacterium]MDG1807232.1 methyl-accepting chemotaxis protein [Pirellulaceae bacterium]MDG2104902.1 methyl-accepting chemotaxis protein [Pirellulaceae bacterium]
MSKRLRKQHWVDSCVQGTLVRRVLMHWCVFFAGTLLCMSILQMLLGNPDKAIMDRLTASGSSMLLLIVIMLSLFPAFALDTVRFSNRFVGPVARLRRVMRELAQGEKPGSLAFRDNDFWSEVGDEFNAVNELVQNQSQVIEDLKSQVAELESASLA